MLTPESVSHGFAWSQDCFFCKAINGINSVAQHSERIHIFSVC